MKAWINHPEAEEGEVMIGYCGLPYFRDVGWKTKRAGTLRCPNGIHCPLVSVFVARSEIAEEESSLGSLGIYELEEFDWDDVGLRPGYDE